MDNIYDFKSIGERIRKERKELGMNQDQLASALNISSRQTIAKWENGSSIPQLEDMLNMCNLFCCELGYLLCEHDLKTREATDIHEKTGLSPDAIEYLQFVNSESKRIPVDNFDCDPALDDTIIRTINFLIEKNNVTYKGEIAKYTNLLDTIASYLFGNFKYYYDDYTCYNENLYTHVEQLGFWDKELGICMLFNDEMFTKSIMLEIQEKLLYARDYLQNNLPKRITPLPSDDDYE